MQDANNQLIIVIVTAILILLFFGVVFLVMISYYNNKKMLAAKEKQMLKNSFEKLLLESRLEIQDEILNNISQEIHDNVGQILSLAKLQLNIIDQAGIFDKERVMDVKESISRAMQDLRDIAKSMNSQRIQQHSMEELVTAELKRISKTGSANTSLDITGTEKEFEFREKLILFRIIQECLQNIIKHANATEVKVSIQHSNNQLAISISDNGKGFDLNQETLPGNGLGLQNIINRTTLIKGKVSITTALNEGTCIHINIPYES
jgi:two-component system, NarL family, sensor kinase